MNLNLSFATSCCLVPQALNLLELYGCFTPPFAIDCFCAQNTGSFKSQSEKLSFPYTFHGKFSGLKETKSKRDLEKKGYPSSS